MRYDLEYCVEILRTSRKRGPRNLFAKRCRQLAREMKIAGIPSEEIGERIDAAMKAVKEAWRQDDARGAIRQMGLDRPSDRRAQEQQEQQKREDVRSLLRQMGMEKMA